MNTEELKALIAEQYENILFMDDYDDCIIGMCTRYGQEPIVAYDRDKVLTKLQKEGMTEEEAIEFYEFNQIGAWMGDTTPCFIETYKMDENKSNEIDVFKLADEIISEAYPGDKPGFWGEARIPNYGILREKIASALHKLIK